MNPVDTVASCVDEIRATGLVDSSKLFIAYGQLLRDASVRSDALRDANAMLRTVNHRGCDPSASAAVAGLLLLTRHFGQSGLGAYEAEYDDVTRPLIFLDIDGVLVSGDGMAKHRCSHRFDANCVAALNALIKETGAKVVVSSVWRILQTTYTLSVILQAGGVDAATPEVVLVVGKTPVLNVHRGFEITRWLTDNNQTNRNYIVIDDDSDMEGIPPERFFKTLFQTGLTPEIAKAASAFLRGAGLQPNVEG